MPFMQRITWSGVALHEGVLPGYPASHGCIRLRTISPQKLWRMTKLGVRVIVSRRDGAVDISHPNFFRPKPKPAKSSIAIGVADGRRPTPAVVSQAEIAQTDSDHVGAPQAAAERPPADAAAYGQAIDAPASRASK